MWKIGTFGPATYWLRPPGFLARSDIAEGTTPDDQPVRRFATRAKLTAPAPADENKWSRVNERLRVHYRRDHLLVTNRGAREEGTTYCTTCGLIEPSANTDRRRHRRAQEAISGPAGRELRRLARHARPGARHRLHQLTIVDLTYGR